jgi:hypothetical protein
MDDDESLAKSDDVELNNRDAIVVEMLASLLKVPFPLAFLY